MAAGGPSELPRPPLVKEPPSPLLRDHPTSIFCSGGAAPRLAMKLEDWQGDWRVHRHEVILQRGKVLSLVVTETTLIVCWFLDD